jgi:hypothetical protein
MRSGQKHSPETIERIRLSNIGKHNRPHTPEEIKKLRQIFLGRKHTPEIIEKIRQSCIEYRRKHFVP